MAFQESVIVNLKLDEPVMIFTDREDILTKAFACIWFVVKRHLGLGSLRQTDWAVATVVFWHGFLWDIQT